MDYEAAASVAVGVEGCQCMVGPGHRRGDTYYLGYVARVSQDRIPSNADDVLVPEKTLRKCRRV